MSKKLTIRASDERITGEVFHNAAVIKLMLCLLISFEWFHRKLSGRKAYKGLISNAQCTAGVAWHPQEGSMGEEGGVALATGAADCSLKLWSAAGKLVRQLTGHTQRLGRVAFHPSAPLNKFLNSERSPIIACATCSSMSR